MKIKRIDASRDDLQQFILAHNTDQKQYQEKVLEIAQEVKNRGDEAVFELTERFDRAAISVDNFRVTDHEIEEAYETVEDDFVFSIRKAIDNIVYYHGKQLKNSWMEPDEAGNVLGQLYRPLNRVGIYVPGGTAAYPSSVLMNAIPAQVAGVNQIAMVSPPGQDGKMNPYTLVAAAEMDLDEIYKMGGAQAIFALAWGTELVPKVELITGPGNIYVTLAKKMVYGDVNIDMLAGPSEILIIADHQANPTYVAADLMSQAEHDVLARCFLVSNSKTLMDEVEAEINRQIINLSRRSIIEQSLQNYGAFILTDTIYEACQINMVAQSIWS